MQAHRRTLSITGPPPIDAVRDDLDYLTRPEVLFPGSRCGPQPCRAAYMEGMLLPNLALLLRLSVALWEVLRTTGYLYVPLPRYKASSPLRSLGTAPLPEHVLSSDLTATSPEHLKPILKRMRNDFWFATYCEIKELSTPERERRDIRLHRPEAAAVLYSKDPYAGTSETVLRPNEVSVYIWTVLAIFLRNAELLPVACRKDDVSLLRAGLIMGRWVFRVVFQEWQDGERPLGWTLINMPNTQSLVQYVTATDHPLFNFPPWISAMGITELPPPLRELNDILNSVHQGVMFFDELKAILSKTVTRTIDEVNKEQSMESTTLNMLDNLFVELTTSEENMVGGVNLTTIDPMFLADVEQFLLPPADEGPSGALHYDYDNAVYDYATGKTTIPVSSKRPM
jgi:hypothetical protein